MQQFHQRSGPRRVDEPYVSEVVDARLYLSGWMVLPFPFLFGGINGPRVDSLILFAILGVVAFWGVLIVRYLPRVGRTKGRSEREIFREALETSGIDSSKWGFLWYLSMGCIVAGLASYWIRFVLS